MPSASSNNTNNNNENKNSKKLKEPTESDRSTNDFQQQQKPYASYREKHGYNWTYGAAEDDVNDDDDESGEYGSVSKRTRGNGEELVVYHWKTRSNVAD